MHKVTTDKDNFSYGMTELVESRLLRTLVYHNQEVEIRKSFDKTDKIQERKGLFKISV